MSIYTTITHRASGQVVSDDHVVFSRAVTAAKRLAVRTGDAFVVEGDGQKVLVRRRARPTIETASREVLAAWKACEKLTGLWLAEVVPMNEQRAMEV